MAEKKPHLLEWLEKATKDLKVGEVFHLPCKDKESQVIGMRNLRSALIQYGKFFPIEAAKLRIYATWRDNQRWLAIEKLAINPLVGYNKQADGTIVRVKVADPERKRRIQLMALDGLSIEEIEELEGALSSEEVAEIQLHRK